MMTPASAMQPPFGAPFADASVSRPCAVMRPPQIGLWHTSANPLLPSAAPPVLPAEGPAIAAEPTPLDPSVALPQAAIEAQPPAAVSSPPAALDAWPDAGTDIVAEPGAHSIVPTDGGDSADEVVVPHQLFSVAGNDHRASKRAKYNSTASNSVQL